MNVAAMVVLAAIVLVEKTSPWGRRISQALGIVALAFAVLVVFLPQLAPGLQQVGSMGNMS